MAISHYVTVTWARGNDTIPILIGPLTGDGENNRDLTVAANTTNHQDAFAFTLSQLELIFILSDTAVTIKTNSTSAPQETITLAANTPLFWWTGSGLTNPFAGNVTTIYVTNSTGSSASVKIRSLVNNG